MTDLVSIDLFRLKALMQDEGLPNEQMARILDRIRCEVDAAPPRPHSQMTPHEAQDWLAANDMSGAAYWRTQPLSLNLVALVGEQLMAHGSTRLWSYDSDWQERYLRGDVPDR